MTQSEYQKYIDSIPHSVDKRLSVYKDGIQALDHMGGFRSDRTNYQLDAMSANFDSLTVYTQYVLDDKVKSNYKNLNLKFDFPSRYHMEYKRLEQYTPRCQTNIKNFICSFNGSVHVGRKLLVSILNKFDYYTPEYCSKNFTYTNDALDGHLLDYTENDRYYRKFFVDDVSEDFAQTINSFGHVRFDHSNNVYNLESRLTESFLHVVSETLPTSYVPYVSEKFLYSIVTKGLFLSYAQPGWHSLIQDEYGFKLYTKLFDYRFDTIENPIERLLELMTMISKFQKLSYDDLYDLYLLELDTIEYNRDHYFSKSYIKYENS